MHLSQLIGLLGLLAVIGAIAFAYVRAGSKIKRDDTRRMEDWPRITGGGTG